MKSPPIPPTRAEQEYRLRSLQAEIKRTQKEMYEVFKEMEQEKKRLHIAKLLAAGRIIEEAGILDTYNENELYLLLVMNKQYLTNDKPINSTGNFNMMHGFNSNR